ncbi:MAG: tagaturonate epimerase family protein, partial [Candidatus Bipolaricaulota bacterium]
MIPAGHTVYAPSVNTAGKATVALVRGPEGRLLWLSQPLPEFHGQMLPAGGVVCPLSSENARALGGVFPWLSPHRLPDRPSFGFGDRLGLATPGHVRACTRAHVFPVLAQQSVRENARTGRTFEEVLTRAVFGAFEEGYQGGFGADADHIKDVNDALHAADLGYTLFTCDPSDHTVAMGRLPPTEVANRFRSMPEAPAWRKDYLDRE